MVMTFTMPVHLHGAYVVCGLLLRTGRCYDAETSTISLLLHDIFLESFGDVIVSSNFEETKGYSPGFFFCGPKKSGVKSIPF